MLRVWLALSKVATELKDFFKLSLNADLVSAEDLRSFIIIIFPTSAATSLVQRNELAGRGRGLCFSSFSPLPLVLFIPLQHCTGGQIQQPPCRSHYAG